MHDATARTLVSTPVCEIIKVAVRKNIATKKEENGAPSLLGRTRISDIKIVCIFE